MTFLLDASVSRYRRPLKIRDFVWEITYWDLRTLNNVKSNFSFNEINTKDTCDIFHCVSVSACCFTVVFFFWLYCITDCYCLRKTKSRLACVAGVWKGWERRPNFLPLPFRTPATQAKSRLFTSIWQSPGPVATKIRFFAEIQVCCKFFSAPTQEGNLLFLSKRSSRKRLYNFPIKLNHLCRTSRHVWLSSSACDCCCTY